MAINYQLMAQSAQIRKQKEEEERKKNEGPSLGNMLLGAATAYLTAGLAPALIGGVSAVSLAPSATNVIAGIKGAAEGMGAKSGEEAAIKGTVKGIEPTVETWAAKETMARSEAAKKLWEEKNPQMQLTTTKFDEKGNPNYEYKDPSIVDPMTLMLMSQMGLKPSNTQINSTIVPIGTVWTDPKTSKKYKKVRESTPKDEGWEIISSRFGGGNLG